MKSAILVQCSTKWAMCIKPTESWSHCETYQVVGMKDLSPGSIPIDFGWLCSPNLESCTLLQTKICNFPNWISDPELKIDTTFRPLICDCCWPKVASICHTYLHVYSPYKEQPHPPYIGEFQVQNTHQSDDSLHVHRTNSHHITREFLSYTRSLILSLPYAWGRALQSLLAGDLMQSWNWLSPSRLAGSWTHHNAMLPSLDPTCTWKGNC